MAVDVSQFASLPDKAPQKGRRPVLANCSIDELSIDPSYQRALTLQSITLIRKIARDWDWSLCNPLIVARREDDSLWVVDGQHRLTAAKLRADIYDLPCVIIHYGGVAREAEGFVALNTNRRPLTPAAIWRAALAAGDADAIALDALIARHGLRVTSNMNKDKWKAGDLANIGQLRQRFARNPELLDRSFAIFARSWPDTPLFYHQMLLSALFALLGEYVIDDEALISRLSTIDEDALVRSIRREQAVSGLGTQSAAVKVLNALLRPAAGAGGANPAAAIPAQPARKRMSFEEQLAAVAKGAPLVEVVKVPKRGVDLTLGGTGEANC